MTTFFLLFGLCWAQEPEHLRMTVEGDHVHLQVASHTLDPTDGGPRIELVGAVHFGERDFFEQVASDLGDLDAAIVEGIRPPGAGEPENWEEPVTLTDRMRSTALRLQWLGDHFHREAARRGRWPRTWRALRRGLEPHQREALKKARIDAWGHPIVYDPPKKRRLPREPWLYSLGADGTVGGSGPNTDIVFEHPSISVTMALGETNEPWMEEELGVVDQGSAMPRAQFRNSDLAIDQLAQRLYRADVEPALVEALLAGRLDQEQVPVDDLRKRLDEVGPDRFRLLLIHFLSNLPENPLPGEDVVVGDRNQLVVEEVENIRLQEPRVVTVGVFYGARHLSDLEARFQQAGWERTSTEWRTVLSVDLAAASISREENADLRDLVRLLLGTDASPRSPRVLPRDPVD